MGVGVDIKMTSSAILIGILSVGCASTQPNIPYSKRLEAIHQAELIHAVTGRSVVVSSEEDLRQMKESFAFIRDTRQYQPNYQPRSMRITCPSGDVFVVLGTEQMRVALWQHVRTQNQWRYALYRTPKPLIECFDRLFKDGQAN